MAIVDDISNDTPDASRATAMSVGDANLCYSGAGYVSPDGMREALHAPRRTGY